MTPRPVQPLGLAFGGLVAMAVGLGIGRFVYTPILPAMMADLGMSAGIAGLIASANYVGYLAGAILLSLPGIAGSRRTWLLSGLAASTIMAVLVGFSSAAATLALVRFVAGLSSAVVFVYAIALVLDRLNALRRPGLSAVHFAGIGVGILVSSAAVTLTAEAGFGWREMWFVAGAISALGTAAVAVLIPAASSLPGPALAVPAAVARPAAQPFALARMVAAYGCLGFGYISGATFIVAIVHNDPATRSLEHWIWPVVGLAALPSVGLWNALARQIGLFRAYAAANLVLGSGILVGILPLGPVGALVSAVTLGGTFVAATSLGIVGARNLSRLDPRRVIAGLTVAFGVGQIVGPVLAGILVDVTGSFRTTSLVRSSLLLAAALLTVTIRDPARAPAA